ncbi:hypothetical protein Tco_0727767 [Tanacetum coccineum]|uniref:Uncharacterized protein n=1 Tax=Tanacetum coccineum TaxID=301880 RepID=A0ABQ4YKA2_9ASTR
MGSGGGGGSPALGGGFGSFGLWGVLGAQKERCFAGGGANGGFLLVVRRIRWVSWSRGLFFYWGGRGGWRGVCVGYGWLGGELGGWGWGGPVAQIVFTATASAAGSESMGGRLRVALEECWGGVGGMDAGRCWGGVCE